MDHLLGIMKKYWGYESFLPLQREAMASVLGGRDSLVVLPTGGGKSLCYQAPALAMDGMAVVVSPLISLMKDQVDSLRECGAAAAYVNSSLSSSENQNTIAEALAGGVKLLYVSPERLVLDGFLGMLGRARISFVAVDEVHCVSTWGHDFRPEYRELRAVKRALPGVAVHGYTATATEHVRDDIVRELDLAEPKVLVGSFDRPNLFYRVERRSGRAHLQEQLAEVLARHEGESGIVYCISRKDVDSLCADLCAMGHKALPYHAGMEGEDRKRNQEAFIRDDADIIVATVAFGMGIDKPNVRYVVHAAMPKSLEHYQQESGRAGRDGLDAECCLLYSPQDEQVWRRLLMQSEGEGAEIAIAKLRDMHAYLAGVGCRHDAILRHFGQRLGKENCGACDVCLGTIEQVSDPLVVGQKILSCVVRLEQRFGIGYTSQVLTGAQEARIAENGHAALSTYGILSEYGKSDVRHWIEQLIGQGFLVKAGEYGVLQLSAKGWQLIRGQETPILTQPAKVGRNERRSKAAAQSWEGVDRGLFEALRDLRRDIAHEKGVAAYMVFGDAALRNMAFIRPSNAERFLNVQGVGERKCEAYGEAFLEAIASYCRRCNMEQDVQAPLGPTAKPQRPRRRPVSQTHAEAYELFGEGASVQEVADRNGWAVSTARSHLLKFIESADVEDPSPWVDASQFARIEEAAEALGLERMRPIHEYLNGAVDYDAIAIALACLRNRRIESADDAELAASARSA